MISYRFLLSFPGILIFLSAKCAADSTKLPILVFEHDCVFDQKAVMQNMEWKQLYYFPSLPHASNAQDSPHVKVIFSQGVNSMLFFKIEVEQTALQVLGGAGSSQIQTMQRTVIEGIRFNSWASKYASLLLKLLEERDVRVNSVYQYNPTSMKLDEYVDNKRYMITNPHFGIPLLHIEVFDCTTSRKHQLSLSHNAILKATDIFNNLFSNVDEQTSLVAYLLCKLVIFGIQMYLWVNILLIVAAENGKVNQFFNEIWNFLTR
ncbi:hypothetical protein MDAP_002048 [Mitosporidium daphniae]